MFIGILCRSQAYSHRAKRPQPQDRRGDSALRAFANGRGRATSGLRTIQNLLCLRIPVQLVAFTLRPGGHNRHHGMREAIVLRSVWPLAASQAFQPVLHVAWIAVGDKWKRTVGFLDGAVQNTLRPRHRAPLLAAQLDVLPRAVDKRISFVRSLLFNQLPALASLSANIDQRGTISHDSREAVGIVAKAGGVTH